MAYNPDEARDKNGMWSGGGGGVVMPSDKARAKATLSLIHNEHKNLVSKLHSNTINNKELDRLDSINGFVQRNRDAIVALK